MDNFIKTRNGYMLIPYRDTHAQNCLKKTLCIDFSAANRLIKLFQGQITAVDIFCLMNGRYFDNQIITFCRKNLSFDEHE